MLEIILIWTCFLLSVWYYKTTGVSKGPPIYQGCLPFVGHAHLLLKCTTHERLMDLFNSFSKESQKLGGVMRWYFGPSEFYWITDPEDTSRVGKGNINKHPYNDFGEKFFGSGLVTGSGIPSPNYPMGYWFIFEGPTWKTHKKLLNPAFSWQVLSNNPAKINKETRKHLINFDTEVGKGPIDLLTDIRLMILDSVFSTLFTSLEKDENFNKVYLQSIDDALEIIISRFQTIFYHSNFLYKFSKLSRKEDDLLKTFDKCIGEMIKRKREIKQTETDKETPVIRDKVFLDLLLELHDEGKFTMKEVKDEINTIMVAAVDPTSCTLNNVLVFLGTYQDIQDKVVDELTKVLGTEDRDVDKQDLFNFVYLEAVIMEYLRLHPPSPLSFRTFEETVQLSKYTLPAGSNCVLALNGVNRDPWWGPDRDEFRPERWFEREEPGHYFAGFSMGKRSCMGRVHAMMSMKIMLAHILRRYRVTADASKLRFKFDFVMKPVAGHFISIERRI